MLGKTGKSFLSMASSEDTRAPRQREKKDRRPKKQKKEEKEQACLVEKVFRVLVCVVLRVVLRSTSRVPRKETREREDER